MSDNIPSDLVEFLNKENKLHEKFRSEWFPKKEKKISDTINRNNIKTSFSSINEQNTTTTKEKTYKTDLVTAPTLINLAQVRYHDGKKLSLFTLVPSSYLFSEEGLMVESWKGVLFREIEKKKKWRRPLPNQFKWCD